MIRAHRRPARPVHSISTVPTSVAEDQDARMRAYLISMGIRTVCFVLAVAVYLLLHHTWAAVIIGIAAVVLPYPAVVLANNASQHRSHTMIEAPPRHELTTGSAMAAPTEPPSSDPTGSQRSS